MRTATQTTIKADVVLPVCAECARDELAAIFTAEGGRREIQLWVGPSRGVHGVAKQVAATLSPQHQHGSTYVFALHWRPVGRGARAYPTLDARLGVTAIDELTSLLSIVAVYRPPLGTLGATADRAALSRIADATVVALLHQLADRITSARPRIGV